MHEILSLLTRHGAAVVFVVAFLEQIGAPVTAIPVIIIAGAVAATTGGSFAYLLGLSIGGALLADGIWYVIGRRYGTRVLGILCRVSLSPDSCVRQTESFFDKWGLHSLIFSKFVPGFSLIAPPLAGAMRRSRFASFLLYDTIGALLWAGASLLLGYLFRNAIDRVLDTLASLGGWALVLLGAAIALFVAHKWHQRRRFYRSLRLARISVDELRSRMQDDRQLVIVDVRTPTAQKLAPVRIPGALIATSEEIEEALRDVDRGREVVLYCT
jgi:membrane protein DedA with SNARE-associated domain